MAIAVIGGLVISTQLSLVVVPAVYEIVDDIERWITPKMARWTTPREAETEPNAVSAEAALRNGACAAKTGVDANLDKLT